MKTLSHVWLTTIAVLIALTAITACSSGTDPTALPTSTGVAEQPTPTETSAAIALPQGTDPAPTTAAPPEVTTPDPPHGTTPSSPLATHAALQVTSTTNPERHITDISFSLINIELGYTLCMIFDDRSAQCDVLTNFHALGHEGTEFFTLEFDPPTIDLQIVRQEPYAYALTTEGRVYTKSYNKRSGQFVNTRGEDWSIAAFAKDSSVKPAYLDDTGRIHWRNSEVTDQYRFKSIYNAYSLCGITLIGEPKCFDGLGEFEYDWPDTPLQKIASNGRKEACVLTTEGQIICWANEPDHPLLATKDGNYTDLQLAGDVACGLTTEGQVNCWGEYANLDTFPEAAKLINTPQSTFTDFSLSVSTACGLTEDQRILCWGAFQEELHPGQDPR